MENARRAERLVVYLRWALMPAVLISLWPHVPAARLLPAALFLAAYNAGALWVAMSARCVPLLWRSAGAVTRACDLALITAVILMAPAPAHGYYALYLFPVAATGYVWPGAWTVLISAGVTALVCAVVSWLSIGSRSALQAALCIGAQSLAAWWGWLLGHQRLLADQAVRQRQKFDAVARLSRELRRARADAEGASPPLAEALQVVLEAVGGRAAAILVRPESRTGGADPAEPAAEAEDRGELRVSVQVGEDILSADTHAELAHHAIASGQPVLLTGEPTEAVLCVPLLNYWAGSRGVTVDAIGALLLAGSAAEEGFGDDDVAAAEMLSIEIVFMLVHHTLYGRLRSDFRRTIMSLSRTLEARGVVSPSHGERQAQVCEMLGQALELTGRVIGMMREAAHLHDIGKIALPDAVLSKPGNLTAEEWEGIRGYPAVSEDICRPLGLEPEVLFLIRHHMERLDGSGYPDGLKGHLQPLPLRILCVANVFDAMSLDRPDRPALPIQERLRELAKRAGIQFDQKVVEVLQSLVAEGRLASLYADAAATQESPPHPVQDDPREPSSAEPAQAEQAAVLAASGTGGAR